MDLKRVFVLILRQGEIERNYDAISQTCKLWHKILLEMVDQSSGAKFDDRFAKALNVAHNYDLPDLEYDFCCIVRSQDLIPVDRCPYCEKLRCTIRDRWCSPAGFGCLRWICDQRVDPYEMRCHCSKCRITQEMVRTRAYYIHLSTGNPDSVANYYQAIDYFLTR